MDGETNIVRGVYVPGVLALRILQQPAGDPGAVLELDGVATQFRAAEENHVIGLLAHDFLAGEAFSDLQIGQEVRIVYGDGHVDYFRVNRLARFQALPSDSQNGNYIDVNSKIPYDARDIFSIFYDGDSHVTFQTCIPKGNDSSWGRLFVTALPVRSSQLMNIQSLINFLQTWVIW